MAQVTFNQEVKHGSITYHTGDTLTIDDALAEYFGAQGWLEGIEGTATVDNPVRLDIDPGRAVEIVPENPYANDTPLTVDGGTLTSKDTNNG